MDIALTNKIEILWYMIKQLIRLLPLLLVQQTVDALLESGYDLVKEQKLILETKLSKEYMKNVDD